MSDSDNKLFIWAQDVHANVKEPIQALKENGWRYGDVPAASNFNWIFKTMTEEMAAIRKDMAKEREEFKNTLVKQAKRFSAQLSATASEFDEKIGFLSEDSDRHFRRAEFNEGIARQICELLREMEKFLRHYHQDFPTLPWPMRPESRIHTEENTNP